MPSTSLENQIAKAEVLQEFIQEGNKNVEDFITGQIPLGHCRLYLCFQQLLKMSQGSRNDIYKNKKIDKLWVCAKLWFQ